MSWLPACRQTAPTLGGFACLTEFLASDRAVAHIGLRKASAVIVAELSLRRLDLEATTPPPNPTRFA
jgi:hypothetical protein